MSECSSTDKNKFVNYGVGSYSERICVVPMRLYLVQAEAIMGYGNDSYILGPYE
jgi:hypothetical protein